MEENNPIINKMPDSSSTPPDFVIRAYPKKKMDKKVLAIIIFAAILLVILVVIYLLDRRSRPDFYIPTLEEKAEAVQETIRQTEEIGLPSEKEQMDIMKYNSQE